MTDEEKYQQLINYIKNLSAVAVAFSGGVDSSLLLKAALDSLGRGKVTAFTAVSPLSSEEDMRNAREVAHHLNAPLVILHANELEEERIAANPPDRCYHCKLHKFNLLAARARELGCHALLEGSNASDQHDYRPGMKALSEMPYVKSPLLALGFSKEDIRRLAKSHGLPNWDLPSRACLASRIPYGERLTTHNLGQVAVAEKKLGELGFREFRVRHHKDVARIEIAPSEMALALQDDMRNAISEAVKTAGFRYVALDLDGYRTGSLNETLPLD